MSLDTAEENFFNRQVALARSVVLGVLLVGLWTLSPAAPARWLYVLPGSYLLLSLLATIAERRNPRLHLPIAADIVVLAGLLVLTRSVFPLWPFYAFVVYALAGGRYSEGSLVFELAASVAAGMAHVAHLGFALPQIQGAIAVLVATFGLGEVVRSLGRRERRNGERRRFLEHLMSMVQFERGLSESVRQVLGELLLEFDCEQALLVICDEDVERLFAWKVRAQDAESAGQETLPLSRAENYLADTLEVNVCWNCFDEREEAFGWDRRTGQFFRQLPPPSLRAREELKARSVLAATVVEASGRAVGRILLVNPTNQRRRFTEDELRWLEQVVDHMGQPLENIFRLRYLRARAAESERSRISRDLHDGILQTLLSLDLQLDVLGRKALQSPEQAAHALASLRKTIKHESDEFRRMLTDMRPVRVDSADLRELMFALAERFRNEAGVAVDLFMDDRDLRASDRVCREVFQIYRESLNNIKKHAKASHVVVKLEQDEMRLLLVVDDNGQGFSFSGRYTSEELDRLRLGPISIKERARSVGGVLTVESNPGHGARLIVEIPLN